nr:11798_t:CDS:2 [Entrophospora candida]
MFKTPVKTKLSDSKNEVNDNIEIVGNRLKYAIINVNDNEHGTKSHHELNKEYARYEEEVEGIGPIEEKEDWLKITWM